MRGWIVGIGLLLWLGGSAALRADDFKPEDLRHVDLITREIIYDPISRKIYASVPGEAGRGGNSVVPIDPMNGGVGTPIFVGSQPRHLAVSDDGKYLYVGLDTGDIRQVDLTTGKLVRLFKVGGARKIAVIPGQHDLIAVSRGGLSGEGIGVALFENGMMRPEIGSPNEFALMFGTRLYTYQNQISSYTFNTYAIKPTGLVQQAGTGDLLSGNVTLTGDGNGRVYSKIGTVLDPEAQRILGQIPHGSWDSTPIPDPTVNRIFFLDPIKDFSFKGSRIYSDDYTTFTALDKMDLPGIHDPGNLIRWGADGLAFRTATQVFFLRTPMVGKPVPPADLSVTVNRAAPAVMPDLSIPCKIVVVNNGPGSATGVVLTLRIPTGLTERSAESTVGKVTTSKEWIVVDIGDLAVGGQCTLTVVVRPTREGEYVMTAVVRSNVWDNQPQNNMAEHVIRNVRPNANP